MLRDLLRAGLNWETILGGLAVLALIVLAWWGMPD